MLTPEEVSEIEKKMLILLISVLGITVIDVILALLCKAASLVSATAVAFFVVLTPLSGLLATRFGRKKNMKTRFANTMILLLFIVGLLILGYATLLTWQEIHFVYRIKYLEFCLTAPVLLLAISYYISEKFERRTMDIIRGTSRHIGDKVRALTSANGVPLIGLYSYLFGLGIVESIIAIACFIYAITVAIGTIRKEIKFAFNKGYREQIKAQLEKILLSIPAIKKVEAISVNNVGKFAYINMVITVTPILTKEEKSELRNIILSRSIYELPFCAYSYVEMKTLQTGEIIIAVPATKENGMKIVPVDSAKIFALIHYDIENVESSKLEIRDIDENEDKIVVISKMLLNSRADGLAINEENKIIENEAKGWYIKIFKIKDENIETAKEKLKNQLKSLLKK